MGTEAGTAGMLVSTAWAHGSGSGALDVNLGPLVFIPAIILFVLFLVLVGRRQGRPSDPDDKNRPQ